MLYSNEEFVKNIIIISDLIATI